MVGHAHEIISINNFKQVFMKIPTSGKTAYQNYIIIICHSIVIRNYGVAKVSN